MNLEEKTRQLELQGKIDSIRFDRPRILPRPEEGSGSGSDWGFLDFLAIGDVIEIVFSILGAFFHH